MTDINYTQLLLGDEIHYTDKIIIKIPKIKNLVAMGDDIFTDYIKPFSMTVREIYSATPEIVDKVEEAYPTLWDMCFDEEANTQVGEMISGQNKESLKTLMTKGFAFWTNCEEEDFQFLSNKKAVNKKMDWIIDRQEYLNFSNYIKTVTLSQPNEDLIAPKNMSKTHLAIWKKLYAGRLYKLKKAKKLELGDKILVLQGSANSFIPFKEINEMTYYQFMNLIDVFMAKEASDQNFQVYTSYKFDTSKMKLHNWRESISLKKIEGVN